jgi:hypothetical protein
VARPAARDKRHRIRQRCIGTHHHAFVRQQRESRRRGDQAFQHVGHDPTRIVDQLLLAITLRLRPRDDSMTGIGRGPLQARDPGGTALFCDLAG